MERSSHIYCKDICYSYNKIVIFVVGGNGNEKSLKSETNLEILSNGTLVITNIDDRHAGDYYCQASNGFDYVKSDFITVKVNGKQLKQGNVKTLNLVSCISKYF